MKHDQALNAALDIFARKNPLEIKECTGAEYLEEKSSLSLPYFSNPCLIGYPNGHIDDLEQSEQVTILQYLNANTKTLPSGKWVSFLELPGGPNHYPPFVKRGIEPLAKKFEQDMEGFILSCQKLGGEEIKMGDRGFVIPAFPYLNLAVAFWQADDEFPAQANILFDSSSLNYLATASLYVLGINLSFKLREESIISC